MKHESFASRLRIALLVLPLSLGAVATAARSAPGSNGNGWGAPNAISPVLQPDPTRGAQLHDVAVNAGGLALAAWDQYTYNNGGGASIGVAVQSGGRWSAPFTLSGTVGYSMSPRVAVGADGTLAVSWIQEDPSTGVSPQRRVQVAVRPPGSLAWTTTTLATGSPGGVSVTQLVPVAVDARGNVTAAWTYWDSGALRSVLQVASRPAGGAWSTPQSLDHPGSAMYPSLAVNARGDAAVVFSVSGCGSCNMPDVAEFASRAGATGTWSVPAPVSEKQYYISGPMVALDASGLATVVYFGAGLESVRQVPAIGWTQPQVVISPPNATSSYTGYDLAVDQSGNAVVSATIFDATIGVDRSSAYVTRGKPDGTWSPALRLTDPTAPVDAYAARAAVSPDGALALVGWIDHYHGTVQVAQLPGGTSSTADAWKTSTIGRGTAFSSFQELMGLDAGSGTVARATWKSAKTGTQVYAVGYGK